MSAKVNFANFICRFGDDKVMLDFAEEIVIPAFKSKEKRIHGKTKSFFMDVEIKNFGSEKQPEPVIFGKLIFDNPLEREQYYSIDQTKIVKDSATLNNAPSAFFVLILSNHKLVYLPEVKHAPSLTTFKATISTLLKIQYKIFIKQLYDTRKKNGIKVTKKAIYKEVPSPSVEVVPLPSNTSLENFLKQYKILKKVTIKLVKPNDEVDSSGLLEKIRSVQGGVQAKNAALTLANNKEGLSISGTLKELGLAAEEGNVKMNFSGEDSTGDLLEGNEELYKLSIDIKEGSLDFENIENLARELYNVFMDKAESGLLRIQEISTDIRQKVLRVVNRVLDKKDED